MDKVINDARIYTDVQGLEQLRYQSKTNSAAATKEVAQQFEAMLMQMVMRSMRDANNALSSDLFGNNQMQFYQDMFDKQLTLMTSSSGNSFAQMIETNLNQQYKIGAKTAAATDRIPQQLKMPQRGPVSTAPIHVKSNAPLAIREPAPIIMAAPADHKENVQEESSAFSSPEQFVKKLWSSAKQAASMLGTDPRILLAQAALETNWGKKILPQGKDNSTHNLFNIKADSSWNSGTTSVDTLEQKNGVLAKERATFRSYNSFVDSFRDYVSFLKNNDRYSEALSKATNPGQFVHALQKAGFATDQSYADKIMKIFSSRSFQSMVDKME